MGAAALEIQNHSITQLRGNLGFAQNSLIECFWISRAAAPHPRRKQSVFEWRPPSAPEQNKKKCEGVFFVWPKQPGGWQNKK